VAKLDITIDAGTATVALDDLVPYVKKTNEVKETDPSDVNGLSRDDRIGQLGYRIGFGPFETKTVTLVVRGVHAGSVHDTCMSEIRLFTK
jgi:hypothetical protein